MNAVTVLVRRWIDETSEGRPWLAADAMTDAAIAHAAGSHEHSGIVHDAAIRPAGFERLDTPNPWPDGR